MAADETPADVYEAPIRAMLAPYSDGIGTVTYDRLWAAYHTSDDYRRLIDAARAPLLTELAEARHEVFILRESENAELSLLRVERDQARSRECTALCRDIEQDRDELRAKLDESASR